MRKKLIISFIIFLLLFNIQSSSSIENSYSQDIFYVGGTGEGNFTSIQEAIRNASVSSQIVVYPGVYNESVDLFKTCYLKSIEPHKAVISYQENDDTMSITANNCIIEGFNITHKTGKSYTSLTVNADNVIIKNNIFYHNPGRGLYFFQSKNGSVLHNQFYSDAIHIVGNSEEWSTHTISNNTIDNKPVIYLKNKENMIIQNDTFGQIILANCSEITLQYLIIGGGDQALLLGHSNNCILQHNSIQLTDYGIHLSYSDDCTLKSNNITGNNYGIYLIHATGNIVLLNNISYQKMYGIWICCNSKQNKIYHNIFFNNNKSAYDLFSNQWYHDSIGNYWTNYQGNDNNNDGIGDHSYPIEGNTSEDSYPIINLNVLDKYYEKEINQTPFIEFSIFIIILISMITKKYKKKEKG